MLKRGTPSIWVPKVLCLASKYPFFDYFEHILADLYNRLINKEGLKNTLEAHMYRIVFQIETPPKDKTKTWYYGIPISQPAPDDLPYVSTSFFSILLKHMEVDIIIRCFTELLFEEKILIVMENTEDLLPVCMALRSLIYPLKYCTVVPFLANDSKEIAISNL